MKSVGEAEIKSVMRHEGRAEGKMWECYSWEAWSRS